MSHQTEKKYVLLADTVLDSLWLTVTVSVKPLALSDSTQITCTQSNSFTVTGLYDCRDEPIAERTVAIYNLLYTFVYFTQFFNLAYGVL